MARFVGAALGVVAMSSHTARAASIVPAPTGSVFGGFTSQQYPSFFQLSKNQKMLEVGSIALDLKCTSGNDFVTEDDFRRLPITASGRLQSSWAVPPTKGSDGTIFGGSGSITARLDRRHQKLTGTWQVRNTFVLPTGQIDACDSGVVKFTALQ